jgi:hypothetical protein
VIHVPAVVCTSSPNAHWSLRPGADLDSVTGSCVYGPTESVRSAFVVLLSRGQRSRWSGSKGRAPQKAPAPGPPFGFLFGCGESPPHRCKPRPPKIRKRTMTNYQFIVPVDPSDDPNRSQAQELYRQAGWATDASPSPDDDRVLCHKEFSSVDEGLAELDGFDDGGAAKDLIYFPWDQSSPLSLLSGSQRFYGRIPPRTVALNMVGPSIATAGVDQMGQMILGSRGRGAPAGGEGGGPNPPGQPPPGNPPDRGPGVASSGDAEVLSADAQIKIIEMYWGALDAELQKTVAEQYFQSQRERELARSGSAAWGAASDWVLLNTADKGGDAQRRLASAMLESRYGVLTQQGQTAMERARVEIAKAGVATADSLQKSIDQWTALAKAAPWFMGAALVISVAILGGAFLLVKSGQLNGYEFPLAIFVCALFVVSPATLLLLGRPLRGIDNASLSGKSSDDANGKSGSDTASPKTAK